MGVVRLSGFEVGEVVNVRHWSGDYEILAFDGRQAWLARVDMTGRSHSTVPVEDLRSKSRQTEMWFNVYRDSVGAAHLSRDKADRTARDTGHRVMLGHVRPDGTCEWIKVDS